MRIPTKHILRIWLFAFIFITHCTVHAQKVKQITGQISAQNEALENVKVSIEGKETVSVSDANGKYAISSTPGDILVYSYIGMETVKILVEDVTRILNVKMLPKLEQLEEVAVTAKKRRNLREEYATNKSIVKTAFGYIDRATSSGNVKVLDMDRVSPGHLCILDMLRGRFAAVNVSGSCSSGGAVSIRSRSSIDNSSPVVFDVDGQILKDVPIWINPENIRRVAVLIGFTTTVMYGSLGAGGVVVINTKAGTMDTTLKNKESQKTVYNPNFFNENALSHKEVSVNNAPQYLKRLRASQSFEEAKTTYKTLSNEYNDHPYFFLDAFSFFAEKWDHKAFTNQILEKHHFLFDNNPVLLKAMAYLLEENGSHKKALSAYTEIAKLRTRYIQSYLDLASVNNNLKDSNRVLDLYLRIDDLIKKGYFKVDTTGFRKFYEQEVKSAFSLNPSYYQAILNDDQKNDSINKTTRLVFEWNDSDAEFELQFVAPSKQFVTWKHTNSANSELMLNEKKFGLNSKDFLIDNYQEGIWKVNLTYLGNKSLTPTFLKVRIYENYGTDQQSKKLKVFKLDVKELNQELFTLTQLKLNPVGAN